MQSGLLSRQRGPRNHLHFLTGRFRGILTLSNPWLQAGKFSLDHTEPLTPDHNHPPEFPLSTTQLSCKGTSHVDVLGFTLINKYLQFEQNKVSDQFALKKLGKHTSKLRELPGAVIIFHKQTKPFTWKTSNSMLACKVYWQLFGPNTQNSTWTTKKVFKQSRQLRKTCPPPSPIQNKQCKMGRGFGGDLCLFRQINRTWYSFPPRTSVIVSMLIHHSVTSFN